MFILDGRNSLCALPFVHVDAVIRHMSTKVVLDKSCCGTRSVKPVAAEIVPMRSLPARRSVRRRRRHRRWSADARSGPGAPGIAAGQLGSPASRAAARPRSGSAGEISNFTRAASGHCYFNLKDAQAQVRCVLFRIKAQLVEFALEGRLGGRSARDAVDLRGARRVPAQRRHGAPCGRRRAVRAGSRGSRRGSRRRAGSRRAQASAAALPACGRHRDVARARRRCTTC